MAVLSQDLKTSVDDLSLVWNAKTTLFQTKEEFRKDAGAVFTCLVNWMKPMLVPELQDQFAANPLSFMATGDQAAAIDAWTHVKDECDKKMSEFKDFFDKKFENTVKQLEKQQVIVEVKQQQEQLKNSVDKLEKDLRSVETTAGSVKGVVSNLINTLEEDQAKEKDHGKDNTTKFEMVMLDLVSTVVSGSEWDISRIRALVNYLASTIPVHAADARMSQSTWGEVVAGVLTNFRISADKRLTRQEVWVIVKALDESKEVESLFAKMKSVIEESEHEGRTYDQFKFQTWARCSKHRSTNAEEKQSVQAKKAKAKKPKRKSDDLPPMEDLREKKKRRTESLRKSVDPDNFEKEKHKKRAKSSGVSERRLQEQKNKWQLMHAELDRASGTSKRRESSSEESEDESQQHASSEESDE